MIKSPVEMIEIIAEGLDYLLSKVVFVGGAVTSLYYDDPAAQKIRPTKDVDFIIEIYSNSEYSQLEEELRKQGFGHDIEDVISVLDGRIELAILNNADNDVKKFLKEQFSIMIRDNRFIESIQGHIGYDSTSSTRAFRIIDFIKEFTAN